MTEQLVFPGFETELLKRPAFAHGVDGAGRLMRELVRRGLPADAWPTAALLVLMLDAEVSEGR